MNVDIVKMNHSEDNWGIFETSREECAEYYDSIPLFSGPYVDCIEWCIDKRNSVVSWRVRKYAHLIPHEFVKDVEARADECMRSIFNCGLKVVSNVIYKASAAWKDQPTHYAYIGDFCGHAKLERTGNKECTDMAYSIGKEWLNHLFGMATALWELGFNLTFDKNGKHTVFGNFPEWVTVDEKY